MKNKLQTANYINKKYLKNNIFKNTLRNYNKIIKSIDIEIENTNETLNILNNNFKHNFNLKDLKRFKKYKIVALLGMGGSILGAEAIYNFLENKIKKKFYFFDDIDSKKIFEFKKKNNLNNVLFLVISKSGNTVETLSNLFSLNILKKNSKNIIVISEKKKNILFNLSQKYSLFYIEHKKNIGGRYSVLSEVGLIPAYFMGINISRLRSNIKKFLRGKDRLFLKDSTSKLASLLKSKKVNNLVFLNYSQELEKFLFWCQQLIAESLGKHGKGFLPLISNVPKDHHSLLQLYLDGPRDKLFHIFYFKKKSKQKINFKSSNMLNYLNNNSLESVKNAQKNALVKTFKKNKIPFREFIINSTDEKTLGELFSYFILETVIIGKLIGINPFDQPAVEQVKLYTKKLLS